jgi:hypothetical protein
MEIKEWRCLCGQSFTRRFEFSDHRQQCDLIRIAFVGDIRRVGNLLHRTPTQMEYIAHRCDMLPGWTTVGMIIFDSWSSAVVEAGFKPTRKTSNEGKL